MTRNSAIAHEEEPDVMNSRNDLHLQDLCIRASEGRMEAIGEIYDLAAGDIFGLALWRTGNEHDAEDVVQETFIRMTMAFRRKVFPASPRAWIMTIAHRVAIDITRRRRTRRETSLDHALLLPVAEHRLEAAGETAGLSRLLSELSPKVREAFFLRYLTGFTFAEIGRITGIPTFSAASRCRLAMKRVRQLLEVTS